MASRFIPNQAEIEKLLHGPAGPVYRHLDRFGRAAERAAKRKALVDSGEMRRKTSASRPTMGPAGLSLVLQSTAPHAYVIHQGHGIIRPRRSPYMKFQPKDLRGTGRFVRTKRVRAVAGYPFLTAGAKEANRLLPMADRFIIVITVPPRGGAGPRGAPKL